MSEAALILCLFLGLNEGAALLQIFVFGLRGQK